MTSNSDYKSLAAVLVSNEVELETLLGIYDWEPLSYDQDPQQYYECFVDIKGVGRKQMVLAKNDEMSNIASATLTTKLIHRFRPRYVIMVGVAAGVNFIHKKEQPSVGDVVVADRVWSFSAGKYVKTSDAPLHTAEIGFIPRPQVHCIDERIREFIKEKIKLSDLKYKVHIGAFASGYSVVANRKIIEKYILPVVERTKVIDMESYGVYYAVEHASEPRPLALVVKGISDFADENKTDDYQLLAVGNSCDFVNYLVSGISAF